VADQPALVVEDVWYRYGVLEAVRGVSFTVQAGEAVSVVGVNGAGKTTIISVCAGLLRASSGHHGAFGDSLDAAGLRSHMRRGVVLVPEGRRIVAKLTVGDNLLLGASCHGPRRPGRETLDFVDEVFPELVEHRDRPAGDLSGGQQQMLAIGRALVARPKVLLLDEPSQGLAPFVQERLAGSFAALRRTGITMVVVEQNLSFARQCTDRLYAITQGRVSFSGGWGQFVAAGGLLGPTAEAI